MPKLQLIEEPWWGRESRISLVTEGVIHATAEDVFNVLADHRQWPSWYPGMLTMELTGRTTGVGVERQVRIGRTRTEQHFTVWETNRRMTYCHVRSTAPGLAAAVEDWELIDDPDGTLVKYVVGAEPRVAARALTPAFRRRFRTSSAGAIDALRGQVELILAEGPIGSIALLAGDPTGGVAIDSAAVPLSDGFLAGPSGATQIETPAAPDAIDDVFEEAEESSWSESESPWTDSAESVAIDESEWTGSATTAMSDESSWTGNPAPIFTDDAFGPADSEPTQPADDAELDDAGDAEDHPDTSDDDADAPRSKKRTSGGRKQNSKPIAL